MWVLVTSCYLGIYSVAGNYSFSRGRYLPKVVNGTRVLSPRGMGYAVLIYY